MATYEKQKLSGSTNGRSIKVAATATLGTTIHTAVSGTTDWDEVYLYAYNSSSVSKTLSIEFGGVSTPDDVIALTVPPVDGETLVIPGFLLQNSLVITAFATTANVITINGYVNRITA